MQILVCYWRFVFRYSLGCPAGDCFVVVVMTCGTALTVMVSDGYEDDTDHSMHRLAMTDDEVSPHLGDYRLGRDAGCLGQ